MRVRFPPRALVTQQARHKGEWEPGGISGVPDTTVSSWFCPTPRWTGALLTEKPRKVAWLKPEHHALYPRILPGVPYRVTKTESFGLFIDLAGTSRFVYSEHFTITSDPLDD